MFFPEPFFIIFGLRSRSSGKGQHDIRYSVQTADLPWYSRYLQTWAVLALRSLAVSSSRLSALLYLPFRAAWGGSSLGWYAVKYTSHIPHSRLVRRIRTTAGLAARANDPRATKRRSLADRDERTVRHQTSIFRRSRLGSALKRSREKVETRRARELVTVGTGEAGVNAEG